MDDKFHKWGALEFNGGDTFSLHPGFLNDRNSPA